MVTRGFLGGCLALGVFLSATAAAAAVPPETSITSGPEGPTSSRTAKFKFSADVARASFECRLDAKPFKRCESPKKYTDLKQGDHTFRVRARKSGEVDASPAVREFTVDTKRPDTMILTGPTGETHDTTPEFTFSSTEPGAFQCRFGAAAFAACESPFSPSSPLPDESHTFRVRAIDEAGNTDGTPASRTFTVERAVTKDLETANIAAAIYAPDTIDLDVPASCGGNPAVDCPSGSPLPAADQLRIASTNPSVSEVVGESRYDVTVTAGVQTLQAIKVTVFGVDCDLTLTSANGDVPTWQILFSLNFVTDAESGEYRIQPANVTINNLEDEDVSLTGGFVCDSVDFSLVFIDLITDLLASQVIADPLCAAPGPDYLGPCPPEP